jgi:hypothetical protein
MVFAFRFSTLVNVVSGPRGLFLVLDNLDEEVSSGDDETRSLWLDEEEPD